VIESRGWPTTEKLDSADAAAAILVLDRLVAHGSVTKEAGVYFLDPNQAIQAAYYRNMIVHYFVPGAIAELALGHRHRRSARRLLAEVAACAISSSSSSSSQDAMSSEGN
jgi:glycerol-3-phosphate O-acyltransferase